MKDHGYRLNEHDHDFHVSFVRGDVILELHYKASTVPSGKGGQAAAEIMDRFLDEATQVSMNDMSFPALSEKHQALMLLMHMERHLIERGVGFRQLCDWAVYLAAQKELSTVNVFLNMCRDCGLLTFAQVVSKTCVRYLGLQLDNTTWCMDITDQMVDALIDDVFRSGNIGKADNEENSALFTGRAMLDEKNQNELRSLIRNLNKLANRHFPITIYCKWLLPIFWFFLPLRYMLRSILGLRKKKNVFRALKQSNKRFELHKSLHFYEVK